VLIGRFQVQCRPEYAEAMAEALVAVETPSRAIPGVVHFDVARSLTDPNAFVVTEVFAHRTAFEQQNSQDEVARVLRLVPEGTVTGDFEWGLWQASTSE